MADQNDLFAPGRILKSVKPAQPAPAEPAPAPEQEPKKPEKETKKPEKEPKKKSPLFWWIYAVVVLLLAVALMVGLSVLKSFLAAYEASQPIHAAQEVFDRCFAAGDFTEAYRLSGFTPGAFEDQSAVTAALQKWGAGQELTFYQVNAEEGTVRYNVVYASPLEEEEKSTDENELTLSHRDASLKVASMTFRQTEEEFDFGFRHWKLEELAMDLTGKDAVEAVVPRGSTLTLNGVPVTEEYRISSEESPYNSFLPDGVLGITWDRYRVEGLFGTGEFACTDKDGAPMTMEEEKGIPTARLNYREDLQGELADFVRQGMEAYACYIQADGTITTVAKYFDTSSLFYRNTRLNPQQWVIDHSGYHFENESVTQFYQYDETTASCRVEMTQVLTKSRAEDYRDHMKMTVFLRKVNGSWRIYDRMTEN